MLLLFYFEAIYLPVSKSLVRSFETLLMNRLSLTSYRIYIPELILLANDVERNPDPVVFL